MKDLKFGATIYISGPMTGIECFNFPQFFYWQVKLEKSGYHVLNPAMMDCMKMLHDGWKYEPCMWDDIIEEDCKIIAEEADALFVLNGWRDSCGALREIETAKVHGIPVYYEEEI